MTSEWETAGYDEHSGWTFTTTLMGTVARKRWRFEPVGESTRVTFVLEYDPKPPVVAPLMDVLILRRKWDQLCERGLQDLKRIIEAEPTRDS